MNKKYSALLILLLCTTAQASVKKTLFKEGNVEGVRYDVNVEGVLQSESRLHRLVPAAVRSKYKITHLALQGVEPYSGIRYEVGHPQLPVIRFLVQGEVTVQAGALQAMKMSDGALIEPAVAPVQKRPGHKLKVKFLESAYQNESFQPQAPYTVVDAGSKDGMTLKLVTLYPIRYQSKNGSIEYRTQFTVVAKRPAIRARTNASVLAFVAGAQFAQSKALQKYAEFKQSQGYQTVVGVVGRDFSTDVQIRAWLQKLLPTGLKHAVIVGDMEDVPSHESTHISGSTDHFYRAIDTKDYESDINGPDIGVGRVSVRDEKGLAMIVDKFIRYQTLKAGQEPWMKAASFVATDDRYEVAEATHNYVISTHTSKTGYGGSFPQSLATGGGDKLYAITHHARNGDLVKAFNQGRSIIDYSGHGSSSSWAGPDFEQSDVRAITSDALPFVIGNACDTAHFSYDEAFGETWLRSPAAAIAYWGSYDSSYWDEDDILERKMADGIFQFGARHLGEITSYALSAVWNQYGGQGLSAYYWETYVLFGDPSIPLHVKKTKWF